MFYDNEHFEFAFFKDNDQDKEQAKQVLADRIRQHLVNNDISLKELGRKTGLSDSFINKLLAKNVMASLESVF